MLGVVRIPTWYYQQHDADPSLDVPAEGYGGWRSADLDLDLDHTALVIMHAWDCGTSEEFPGWHRAVEYIPRAEHICRAIFPPLLDAARASGLRLYHVVAEASRPFYQDLPGYRRALAVARARAKPEPVPTDPIAQCLRRFRTEHVFPGIHNQADVERGFRRLGFAPSAHPVGDEGIAEDGAQLSGLCAADGISHLIYAGFAINWCLLMSPGGMLEMSQYGVLCSALRQAVTAVENRETARGELGKEMALWRVSVAFGFVYDVDDLVRVLNCSVGTI